MARAPLDSWKLLPPPLDTQPCTHMHACPRAPLLGLHTKHSVNYLTSVSLSSSAPLLFFFPPLLESLKVREEREEEEEEENTETAPLPASRKVPGWDGRPLQCGDANRQSLPLKSANKQQDRAAFSISSFNNKCTWIALDVDYCVWKKQQTSLLGNLFFIFTLYFPLFLSHYIRIVFSFFHFLVFSRPSLFKSFCVFCSRCTVCCDQSASTVKAWSSGELVNSDGSVATWTTFLC